MWSMAAGRCVTALSTCTSAARARSLRHVLARHFPAINPARLAARPLATTSACHNERPRLVDMKNGPKSPALFLDEEFETRLSKLRKYMAENDIGGVVLTSYHNINYYSGFVFCYFGRTYGLVVTQDTVTSVSAGIDGGQPWRRAYGNNVTYTDWQRDNFFHAIRDRLKDVRGKVGLEFDCVPVDHLAKFNAALPDNEKTDVGEPTMRMRMRKSPAEVEVIKQGARIADIGGAAGRDAIGVGVPEHEVALAATRAMVREIAKTYPNSDVMDTWTWFQSGLNTDGAHNPVTTKQIEKGDILSLNCFPMIQGYYTALERTLFCEHVSDAHLRYWEINCDVHRRGLELIKPGTKCSDIARELNELYRSSDTLQYRSFGYGHSFGTLCHYYGREAALELREDIDTVLEPGMVVSMEPMVMIPEGRPGAGGYREHDILVIDHAGQASDITGFPYGPKHNIVSN